MLPLLLDEPLDDEDAEEDEDEEDDAEDDDEAAGADAVVVDAGLDAGELLDEEPRLSFR